MARCWSPSRLYLAAGYRAVEVPSRPCVLSPKRSRRQPSLLIQQPQRSKEEKSLPGQKTSLSNHAGRQSSIVGRQVPSALPSGSFPTNRTLEVSFLRHFAAPHSHFTLGSKPSASCLRPLPVTKLASADFKILVARHLRACGKGWEGVRSEGTRSPHLNRTRESLRRRCIPRLWFLDVRATFTPSTSCFVRSGR
jgi:hypothetical protein